MKTIIAGLRNFHDYGFVADCLAKTDIQITEVVSGRASGVDHLGEIWAKAKGLPIKVFRADWDKYGKAAGPIRNKQMAQYAEALIAFWDGKSPGIGSMLREADRAGLKFVKTYYIKGDL